MIFAQCAIHILLARILAGLSNGGYFVCIAMYIAEIADDQQVNSSHQ